MKAGRRGVWWPGLAIGLAAAAVGLGLALSGRPGVGYAVVLIVLGLLAAAGFLVRSWIPRP